MTDPKESSKTAAPTSKGERFWKLAKMTASVAGKYATTKVKSIFQSEETAEKERSETHRATGEALAKTLGELKGAVMKVGQMASIASDLLPKEITEGLRSLQREAPPMEFSVIKAQIEKELGAPLKTLFADIDEEPFAAASIGQVHRAMLEDGREVVVKVQYPGVDDSCDADLAHLKVAFRASGILKIKKEELNKVFEEIRQRLHEELNYRHEAENLRLFREYYRRKPFIVIPDVIEERSAKRVLTLTYEPGDPLEAVKGERYPQAIRDQIGATIFRMLCSQIFDLRAVHGDPNPGNFAFRPDGSIVVYDFGCVKHLLPRIVRAYRDTIKFGIDANYQKVEQGLLDLGVRNPQGPPVEPEYYAVFRDILLLPFIQEEPFDYGNTDLHAKIIEQVPGVLKRLESFQPPVELVFLDRAVVGQYGNMRKIAARGRFLEILHEFLALPQEGEDGA